MAFKQMRRATGGSVAPARKALSVENTLSNSAPTLALQASALERRLGFAPHLAALIALHAFLTEAPQ
jgi:hypothetical protein